MKTCILLSTFCLAYLTSDTSLQAGSLVVWNDRTTTYGPLPIGNDFAAVEVGDHHIVALRSNGQIATWGGNSNIYHQVPDGSYKAISVWGGNNLALRANGTLAAWGSSLYGILNIPPDNGFKAIAAGGTFGLALKSNGSIVGWGDDGFGQISQIPGGNDFVSIAAGTEHGIALRNNGSLAAWGNNYIGQTDIPVGNDFIAIAAGRESSLALRSDGTLAAWGILHGPNYDWVNVPEGNDFVEISVGTYAAIARRSDGSIVTWGDPDVRALPGTNFTAVSTDGFAGRHSAAIVNDPPRPGDFDFDGDVDGRDFLYWQQGRSLHGRGVVDLQDWQQHYNDGMSSTLIAVPEPSSGSLWLIFASLALVLRRFNQPKHRAMDA